jgi:hypothetical protein
MKAAKKVCRMNADARRIAMSYRIEEWVDDESRNSGKNMYTVYEILPDGTEEEILETRDRDAVESLVEGEKCDWPEE